MLGDGHLCWARGSGFAWSSSGWVLGGCCGVRVMGQHGRSLESPAPLLSHWAPPTPSGKEAVPLVNGTLRPREGPEPVVLPGPPGLQLLEIPLALLCSQQKAIPQLSVCGLQPFLLCVPSL